MILCVNANPAIDKTVYVENFQLNAIHRPTFELALAGGKGCNVARVLKTLGEHPLVTGWVGGLPGQIIAEGLQAEGIDSAFVQVDADSRTCLSIYDPLQKTMTEIYEKGRPVSAAEVEAFYRQYQDLLTQAAWVTLSGSLPPGVPVDFYAVLIRMAQAAGIRTILDSSDEPLRRGVEESAPFMLKCNRSELSRLIGQPVKELNELVSAARRLSKDRRMWVVITLGAAGVVSAGTTAEGEDQVWLAQPPEVEAVSAVGSGDAVLAGLVCGLSAGRPFEAALRLGTAAGAANTLQIGAGRLSAQAVEDLQERVKIAPFFLDVA
jgi:tagatose 6-phosphate kinase